MSELTLEPLPPNFGDRMNNQLRYQRRHKAQGLCQMCSAPAYLGGARCRRHMVSNGKNLELKARWKAVDWSRSNSEIARRLGVSSNIVWQHRRKLK